MPPYHCHKQLVKPLQFELSARPHVRPEAGLHQANAATGQHLSWRPRHVSGVVHLSMGEGKKVSIMIITDSGSYFIFQYHNGVLER